MKNRPAEIEIVETRPLISHYNAKQNLRKLLGKEPLGFLLEHGLTHVVSENQYYVYMRHVPSGNTVFRCVKCDPVVHMKALSYKVLEFARRQCLKGAGTNYLCPFCYGHDIEVMRGQRWIKVSARPTSYFTCMVKGCRIKRPTAQGIVKHYQLVRKRLKEEHRIAFKIAFETGRIT